MGIVYQIIVGDRKYYGSTNQMLCKRQGRHNDNLRNQPNQLLYRTAIENNITKLICEKIYEGDDYLEYENNCIENDINCLNMRRSKGSEETRKQSNKKWRQSAKGKLSKRNCDKRYREKIKEKTSS